MKLSRKDAFRIAAEAEVDPRTVLRIYEGEESKGLVRARVITAARKLKIQLPAAR